MLGKSQWFARRKYGGWGIRPATWQGWAYIAAVILPFIALNSLDAITESQRNIILGAWACFVILDALDIMVHLDKDERSRMHEALAERNAAWYMVAVLTGGFAYRLWEQAAEGIEAIDPVIAIALFGAVIVKGVSNFYLGRKY